MKTARAAIALIAWRSRARSISWASRLRYMSGPIITESTEEYEERMKHVCFYRKKQAQQEYLWRASPWRMRGIGNGSVPPESEQHETDHHRKTQAHHHS